MRQFMPEPVSIHIVVEKKKIFSRGFLGSHIFLWRITRLIIIIFYLLNQYVKVLYDVILTLKIEKEYQAPDQVNIFQWPDFFANFLCFRLVFTEPECDRC